MLENPLTIAIDRDDVLMDCITGLHAFHNDRYGTNATVEGSHVFDLDILWGCQREDVMPRLLEYYQTHYYRESSPIVGAKEGVTRLKEQGHRLVIVTSTHESALDILLEKLDEHYSGLFKPDDVYLTNLLGGNGPKKTKPVICAELGAQVLIDDHFGNLNGCKQSGVQGILMRYPWNRAIAVDQLTTEGVLAAENWEEVVALVERSRTDR